MIRTFCVLGLTVLAAFPMPVQAQERITASVRILTGSVQTESALRFVVAASGQGDRQVRLKSGPYWGAQMQLGTADLPVVVQLGVLRTVGGALEYEDYRQVSCGDNCTRVESTFTPGVDATSTWWTGMVLLRSPAIGRLYAFAGLGGGQQRLDYDTGEMPAHVASAFPNEESVSFRCITLGAGVDVLPRVDVNANVTRLRSGFWFEEANEDPRSGLGPQADMQYSIGVSIRLF